ncbi:aldo/keto reductase [Nocardia sp. NPDC050175]|uniref:aldo/keto reductase n=1 Tax=Nocardia sp. NPDC050175 TaxID=3364317 RepID=UPI0037A64ED5
MRYTTLGAGHPRVSAVGLGCMGMTSADGSESPRTLDRAAELGITLLDTADAYDRGANEDLLGRWLRHARREEVVVSTKFGLRHDPDTGMVATVDTSPEYVPVACDASLRRLGTDYIDVYYIHRRDPEVPIEDTVGAMAALVSAGKVAHLGLSEVSVETLRRAHAVHPIAAIQLEYSLFTRNVVEGDMLRTCRELGVAVVAYSPLGRGMLAGLLSSRADLDDSDGRRRWPRFAAENIAANLALVHNLKQVAATIGCTPAQAALAWLLAQGDDIVPIPGTKQVRYLEQNVAAAELTLTTDQVRQLAEAVPMSGVAGDRYPKAALDRIGH